MSGLKYDLVVFDMAGTTVEDRGSVNRCLREALNAVGIVVDPQEVNSVMGLPKPEAIRILLSKSADRARFLDRLNAIYLDFVRRMIDFYEHDPSVVEVPGCSRVFETLRRAGIKIGLDTGFSREIADRIVKRLGWLDRGLIDAIETSDEIARGRPHPDMIFALMKSLGLTDVSRVVKIGDAPADLIEGSNAGCGLVVGATGGSHSQRELEEYPHTHIINSLDELPSLLGI